MPFGLKNAGATFQRFIDTIFASTKNVFVYLDDILIASETLDEHLHDIENVFQQLSKFNLKISVSKCEFIKEPITFLGYEISSSGIKPPAERTKAISDFIQPSTSTELRRFLGMLNFFRHMIPNFANIAHPLTELIRLHPSSKKLPWPDDADAAFTNVKQALVDCPTLTFPTPHSSQYQIVSDSSGYAVGAALYQMIDDKPAPISFFSKKLSSTQKSYSTYDRELLGAYLAVCQFKTLIDGHTVDLFLDHKPIVSAFYSKSVPKSDRRQRQLSFISEYVTNVHYIRGFNNIVADCLSRPVCATSVDPFDLPALARAQIDDPEIKSICHLIAYELSPDLKIWCENSSSSPRPYVPPSFRSTIISSLHQLSHPGVKESIQLVKQR